MGVKTIETYRSRLTEKLGLRTRSEVIRFAVQMGLLTPETLETEPGAANGRQFWFRSASPCRIFGRACAFCQGFPGQSLSFLAAPR